MTGHGPGLDAGAERPAIGDRPSTALVLAGASAPASVIDHEAETADFNASLGRAIEDLRSASLQSQHAHERIEDLADELKERGFFGALWATASAKTDKELALQVKAVAASLRTTQSVLDVILRIETRENRLLDSFSKAVVDKIEKITSDTLVLRGDQKSAALAFLEMLNARINEQKQLQSTVLAHTEQLERVDEWQQHVDQGLRKVGEDLGSLRGGAEAAESQLQESLRRIRLCEEEIRSEARRLGETADVVAQQRVRIDHLEAANRTLSSELTGMIHRLGALEGMLKTRAAWRSRVIRYAPTAAALGLAVFAVAGV